MYVHISSGALVIHGASVCFVLVSRNGSLKSRVEVLELVLKVPDCIHQHNSWVRIVFRLTEEDKDKRAVRREGGRVGEGEREGGATHE